MTDATREDIHACFRLLLGREPHAEELPGHMGLVGSPLPQVVLSYLNSLEFKNRGLLSAPSETELILLDRFKIYVSSNDRLIATAIRGGYEPEVTAMFTKHARPGSCVIDIGANCGYFSLLACSLGCTVYAFEPLQANIRMLSASRVVNRFDSLNLIAAAASDKPQTLTIGAAYTNGIVGHTPNVSAAALTADYVPAVRVDDCVPHDTTVSLLKIDVEGHEYLALKGCAATIRRSRPIIISEFGPAGLRSNSGVQPEEYLDLLAEFGYRTSVIGKPDAATADSILRACEGTDHVDIIAIPAV